MKTIPLLKKLATAALLVATLGASGALAGGCAYGGVASTPDGTVIIARNGMLGAARHIYVCKLAGSVLTCVENPSAP
jgi:hypothetical protein